MNEIGRFDQNNRFFITNTPCSITNTKTSIKNTNTYYFLHDTHIVRIQEQISCYVSFFIKMKSEHFIKKIVISVIDP